MRDKIAGIIDKARMADLVDGRFNSHSYADAILSLLASEAEEGMPLLGRDKLLDILDLASIHCKATGEEYDLAVARHLAEHERQARIDWIRGLPEPQRYGELEQRCEG